MRILSFSDRLAIKESINESNTSNRFAGLDVVIARGPLHRVRGLGPVQAQSRSVGDEVGLGPDHPVHGSNRFGAVRDER
jgi:hypothetical protein